MIISLILLKKSTCKDSLQVRCFKLSEISTAKHATIFTTKFCICVTERFAGIFVPFWGNREDQENQEIRRKREKGEREKED